MNSAIELYETLASAPDDKTRARLIDEAFERHEERCPRLPELAAQALWPESELPPRRDIDRVRAGLMAAIERVRAGSKTDIERLRAALKTEIAHVKPDLLKWPVPLMFAQVAAIAALEKLL